MTTKQIPPVNKSHLDLHYREATIPYWEKSSLKHRLYVLPGRQIVDEKTARRMLPILDSLIRNGKPDKQRLAREKIHSQMQIIPQFTAAA